MICSTSFSAAATSPLVTASGSPSGDGAVSFDALLSDADAEIPVGMAMPDTTTPSGPTHIAERQADAVPGTPLPPGEAIRPIDGIVSWLVPPDLAVTKAAMAGDIGVPVVPPTQLMARTIIFSPARREAVERNPLSAAPGDPADEQRDDTALDTGDDDRIEPVALPAMANITVMIAPQVTVAAMQPPATMRPIHDGSTSSAITPTVAGVDSPTQGQRLAAGTVSAPPPDGSLAATPPDPANYPIAAPIIPSSRSTDDAGASAATPTTTARSVAPADPAAPIAPAAPAAARPVVATPRSAALGTSIAIGRIVPAVGVSLPETPIQPAPDINRPRADVRSPTPTPVTAIAPLPSPVSINQGPALQVFGAAIAAARRAARPSADDRTVEHAAFQPVAGTVAAPIAATGGAQQAPLDLCQERWPHAMVDRIAQLRDTAAAASAHAAETRIRIVPDALGTIDVSINRDGDAIAVHFQADQAATRTLLQDAQGRLADIAEARGLRLSGSSVDGGSAGSGQQRQPQPQQPALPGAPPRTTAGDSVTADDADRDRVA